MYVCRECIYISIGSDLCDKNQISKIIKRIKNVNILLDDNSIRSSFFFKYWKQRIEVHLMLKELSSQ